MRVLIDWQSNCCANYLIHNAIARQPLKQSVDHFDRAATDSCNVGIIQRSAMKRSKPRKIRAVALPWSDGTLSARIWQVGKRSVAGVPELGLHCYGDSEPEAVFRLFTSLLKYYRQLSAYKDRISERGLSHLNLLKVWVHSVENRMMISESSSMVIPIRRP